MPKLSTEKEWDKERTALLLIALVVAFVFIAVLNSFGSAPLQTMGTDPTNGKPIVDIDWGRMIIDYTYYVKPDGKIENHPNYLACQNFMWIAFFIGIGEAIYRLRRARAELAETEKDYLPEDESTLLTSQDLVPIYKRARKADQRLVFPKLIKQLVMSYRKSGSADQSHTVLSSSLDLCLHSMDLKYTILRYVVWIIPTLGFLGTVIGIADALNYVGAGTTPAAQLLQTTTQKLSVAFYTTLIGLVQSGILVLFMNLIQSIEERAINRSGQHCLENLINRLIPSSTTNA